MCRNLMLCSLIFAATLHSATFLSLTPGARALGMGQCFTALADDPTACYYNPAGLGFVTQPEFLSMNLAPPPGIAKGVLWAFITPPDIILNQHDRSPVDPKYFSSLRLAYVAATAPLGQNQGIGLSIHYLDNGRTTVITEDGEPVGSYHGYDYAIGLSYGRKIFNGLSGGISAKYIRLFLYPVWEPPAFDDWNTSGSCNAYSFDAGVLYRVPIGFSVGASLLHLGPSVEMYGEPVALPLTGRVGAAQSISQIVSTMTSAHEHSFLHRMSQWFNVQLTFEYMHDFRTDVDFSKTAMGFEVKAFNVLSYRQGFRLAGDRFYLYEEPKSFGLDLGIAAFDITVTNSDTPFGKWWIQSKFSPLSPKPACLVENENLDRVFLNIACLTIPGAGQFYNGDAWKGVAFAAASFLIADAILERDVRPDWQYTAAVISLPVLYIGSGIEANLSHRR